MLSLLAYLGKFKKIISLFQKEKKLNELFSDITGKHSDGFRKEVADSIEDKTGSILDDIRSGFRK